MSKLELGLNKKFGRLTVLEIIKEKNKNAKYKCRCDCGNEIITYYNNLYIGKTLSCGCLNNEQRHKKDNKSHKQKHGLSKTRLAIIRNGMISRCYNKNSDNYKRYGGRGIKICDEWKNKETGMINFYNWAMQNGYREDLTIDRIDNDKGYYPDNCRWTTLKEQANNKNPYIRHEFDKKNSLFNKEIVNLLNELGYSHVTIRSRMKKYKITLLEAIKMKKYNGKKIYNEYLPEYLDKTNIEEVRNNIIKQLKRIIGK